MKIMIIKTRNANEKKFDDITRIIKSLIFKLWNTKRQFIIIKKLSNLKNYLIGYNFKTKNKENKSNSFNLIDIVFIYGNSDFKKKWKRPNKFFLQFLKNCLLIKKNIFLIGDSILYYIMLLSLNLKIYNILNSPITENVQFSIKNYQSKKKDDCILDSKTGDLFFFSEKKIWEPKFNIGFFHQEKSTNPDFALKNLFRSSINKSEKHVKINNDKYHHYLFRGVSNKFFFDRVSQWNINKIQYININMLFTVLARNSKLPVIMEFENSIMVYFDIEEKNKNSVLILENFIKKSIMEIRDKKIEKISFFYPNILENKNELIRQKSENKIKNQNFIIKRCGFSIRKNQRHKLIIQNNSIQKADFLYLKNNFHKFYSTKSSNKKINFINNENKSSVAINEKFKKFSLKTLVKNSNKENNKTIKKKNFKINNFMFLYN